ncbi:MAG TPA: mannosyltransferase family protein [Mycobacteriales bacterium]|nr:mannosyltransferase family protein [Mycobacteriales bacterium]
MRTSDRAALEIWLWSRLAVFLLAAVGVLALAGNAARAPGPVQAWARWDADLLRKIAEHGYDGRPEHYADVGVEAFFPGFPLLLRLVHLVVPSWTAAGLLISLVAGAVACVALARLAAADGVDGPRAVLYLVASPSAVFLAAGYTEALFLALALPAWLAARDGRWAAAGLLVAAACTVRVNGVFLAVAVGVHYLVLSRGRLRPDALWLLAPLAAVAAYAGYLRWLTGDWLRWFAAQEQGWDRRLTAPWDALTATVGMATPGSGAGAFVHVARLEIAAVAVGLLLTGVLLRRRRWAEAVYVGLSVGALATSTFYLSVARSTLLWFPLWVALAALAARWRWVHPAYLAVAVPLMVLGVLLFTTGRWAG